MPAKQRYWKPFIYLLGVNLSVVALFKFGAEGAALITRGPMSKPGRYSARFRVEKPVSGLRRLRLDGEESKSAASIASHLPIQLLPNVGDRLAARGKAGYGLGLVRETKLC